MYTVAVTRDFIARHFLIGGDWGDENEPHAHHYIIELQLEGRTLDTHGYLSDISVIESTLDIQVAKYKDRLLNELPEFEGLNPSIENFARILCKSLCAVIQTGHLATVSVKLWENEWAWTQYRKNFNTD